jgi:hypothetical protein
MFFLVKGKVAYILPRFGNKRCLEISQGEHFGHEEMFNHRKMSDNLLKLTSRRTKSMQRTFQAVALEEVNSLTLSITDIEKMREEFPDIYESLLNESVNLCSERFRLKKRIVKQSIKKNHDHLQGGFSLLFKGVDRSSSESDNNKKNAMLKRTMPRHQTFPSKIFGKNPINGVEEGKATDATSILDNTNLHINSNHDISPNNINSVVKGQPASQKKSLWKRAGNKVRIHLAS